MTFRWIRTHDVINARRERKQTPTWWKFLSCSVAASCQTRTNSDGGESLQTFQFRSVRHGAQAPTRSRSRDCAPVPQGRILPPSITSVAGVCLMITGEQSFALGLRGNELRGRRRRSFYWLLQAVSSRWGRVAVQGRIKRSNLLRLISPVGLRYSSCRGLMLGSMLSRLT